MVAEPATSCFAMVEKHRNYRQLKNALQYDDQVAHKLHQTSKKITVQMKGSTLSGKNLMPVNGIWNELKYACGACGIHGGKPIQMFKPYLSVAEIESVEDLVTWSNCANCYHDGALGSYSGILKFHLKGYVTEDNKTELNAKLQNIRQVTRRRA